MLDGTTPRRYCPHCRKLFGVRLWLPRLPFLQRFLFERAVDLVVAVDWALGLVVVALLWSSGYDEDEDTMPRPAP